jgi:hypothetical protein
MQHWDPVMISVQRQMKVGGSSFKKSDCHFFFGSLNNTHPLPVQRIGNLERQMVRYNNLADNSSVRRERFNLIMGRR